MQLEFIGAAHEVTGSLYYLECAGARFLVDCGMEQGTDIYENKDLPVDAGSVDFVLLTHAHIDHSGNLPLLYAKGFRGKVYATRATAHLCGIMLRDSTHIQEFEAEWRNRKGKRQGKAPYVPPYTMEDTENLLKNFVGCEYEADLAIAPGITARFTDAGHLLGSASIRLTLTEGDKTRTIIFSGDIGNTSQPLIRDPRVPEGADYVVMESTYGDRSHGPRMDSISFLADVLQRTFDRGGNVVIPSFAVGRTQEMLYFIRQIKNEGRVKGHDGFKVYVDSPLAIEATKIFTQDTYECYDEDAMALVRQGINPLAFDGLVTAVSSDESKAINTITEPKVIISASGMCDAGRIKHHLKHNLWRPECTILFVGYQSAGTLGRILYDGAKEVRIFGEDIAVAAEINTLTGVSGHADVNGLLSWIKAIDGVKRVFVTHGEDTVTEIFAGRVTQETGRPADAPFSGTVFDLALGDYVLTESGIRLKKAAGSQKSEKAARAYEKLLAMGRRLMDVIKRNEGGANKDLEKFSRELQSVCDRWDR